MVRAFGGDVFTDAFVRDIIIEHGRAVGVRVSNTSTLGTHASSGSKQVEASALLTEVRCQNVVWASGVYNLYTKALPQNIHQVKEFQDPTKRTCKPSDGHIYLF
jgi:phytoene dehydrogenase-like protein